MRLHRWLICCVVVTAVFSSLLSAQQDAPAQSLSVVPRVVNFSGKAVDAQDKPVSGIAGITFSIYKDQYEGAPLWMETQNITADAEGNYSVQLGATKPQGLPLDLFSSGEARWLGVRVNGGEEQARVLLLSVPYALKAADAETIGGLPPSAFVLAAPPTANAATAKGGSNASSITPATSSDVTTTGGAAKTIPLFTTATNIQNSILTQTGTTAVNVKGNLTATGVVSGSSFDIGSRPFAFGSFTKGNAFLGFAGNTTMTGEGNTATGPDALKSNTDGCCNTASGIAALESNTTGSLNTATGYSALNGNTTGTENTATGYAALALNTIGQFNTATGRSALFDNIQGNDNTAIGDAALLDNTASGNTAVGFEVLESNTTGNDNTAIGYGSGGTLDSSAVTGTSNTLVGAGASLSTGNLVGATAIGSTAKVSCNQCLVLGSIPTNVGIGTPAPAATLHLDLLDHGAFDYLLIGNTSSKGLEFFDSGAGVDIRSFGVPLFLNFAGQNTLLNYTGGKVGIGEVGETPSNLLTLQQGGGPAIADGWNTYSSRRWKTNIHPLQNALSKVEQLRGVSYDLKDSGKHEIGVIAEEVGSVVPELVTYEDNGKDARSVDYSRLTALLIEAVKQQQNEIQREKSLLRRQAAAIHDLKSELQETRQTMEKIKAQAGATQRTLVAKKVSAKSGFDEGSRP